MADGGFGTTTILDKLSFDKFQNRLFMGYSDLTVLNNALLAKNRLISFNGPMVCMRDDTKSLREALKLLTETEPWELPHDKIEVFSKGRAIGQAVGGNLTMFCTLVGTKYMPKLRNSILFLEDIEVDSYKLLLLLSQLDLAEVFKRVGGVILGEFTDVPKIPKGDPPFEETIKNYFKKMNIPVMSGFKFSHGSSTACIPIGATTLIDTASKLVKFQSPLS